jgi:hypothetical protein
VNPTNFLTELKRRNVHRAAVAYGVVAWFLMQLTTQVLPLFEIPNFAMRFVVIALVIGFTIAMLLAWLYERTPEGIVRTEDLHPAQARSIQHATGRILDLIIIGALLLVIAMLIVGRFPLYRQTGESISQKSIAVLPFSNLSKEQENAFFADGIQDEILTDLARVGDLKVISRSSVSNTRAAGVKRNLREIANAVERQASTRGNAPGFSCLLTRGQAPSTNNAAREGTTALHARSTETAQRSSFGQRPFIMSDFGLRF